MSRDWKVIWWDCRHDMDGMKDEPCPYCRIQQLEVENAKLRRAIDDIKIRSYELGQRELHDMALDVLKENDK